MKIFIATDHNGYNEKYEIIKSLEDNYEVIDLSPDFDPNDDYPTFAFKVAESVKNNENSYGVLLCGTGIGMSIAANKIKGIRCAHVTNKEEARLAREHNNANVIALSYKKDLNELIGYIKTFIETSFSDEERHKRRVDLIKKYEEEN